MSHKLHNPKSHAPAVYIPCWLIQIPINLLSYGAKMTYGRLSQWSNSTGRAYRSAIQLSEELGCSTRSIESYLKELKTAVLIGTYHPQAGGVNHFEFYDHPWMHEPIKDQLVYKDDKFTPPQDPAVPSAGSCGTPPQDPADINNKEIKEIKCVGDSPSHTQKSSLKRKEACERIAFESEDLRTFFNTRFQGINITYESLFKECQEHYESKGQWVTKKKWKLWLENEKIDNYPKAKKDKPKLVSFFTDDELNLVQKYKAASQYADKYPERLNYLMPNKDEQKAALEIMDRMKAKESQPCQPKSNARRNSLTSVSSLVSHLS